MVAKTLYGLEDVLAEELNAIGADDVEAGRRMVSFTGDKAMLYKANFSCRTALRILKPVSEFKADDADAVYENVKEIEWDDYLSVDKTFAVDAVVYSDDFNHSKFVAYRTKDAIVDYFNEKYEKRPSVRVNKPDVYINIHISRNDCTVSLDSSGESLHKRGYRVSQVDAPLNEVLAAGMILKTGWRGESDFIDPMCGSGTLLIEAAMIALNIAPGVYRKEYAFELWPDFDRDLFDEIYNDESEEREFKFKCIGSDISPIAVDKTTQNVSSASLTKYIEVKTMPFQQYTEAPRPGILVMNPPYGERISTNDIFDLYSMIGERLKHVFSGYNAWILSYKEECFEKIALRPKHRMTLMNGDLECEYRCYELFDGKNKDYKRELKDRGESEEKRFEGKEQKLFKRKERSFDKDRNKFDRDKKPFDRERKPFDRDKKPFDRDKKPFDRERKPFDKDKKPFDRERKPFDRDKRTFGRDKRDSDKGERSFDRDKKPFSRDKKPFDRDKKPFDRDKKPFDRERKPFSRDKKSFDKGKGKDFKSHDSFGGGKKSFGKSGKPFDRKRKSFGEKDD
jgi:Predicted N6-adenine-specific DNA methylase